CRGLTPAAPQPATLPEGVWAWQARPAGATAAVPRHLRRARPQPARLPHPLGAGPREPGSLPVPAGWCARPCPPPPPPPPPPWPPPRGPAQPDHGRKATHAGRYESSGGTAGAGAGGLRLLARDGAGPDRAQGGAGAVTVTAARHRQAQLPRPGPQLLDAARPEA